MTPPEPEESSIPEYTIKFDENGNLVYRVDGSWQPYARLPLGEGGFEMRDHDPRKKYSEGTEE